MQLGSFVTKTVQGMGRVDVARKPNPRFAGFCRLGRPLPLSNRTLHEAGTD